MLIHNTKPITLYNNLLTFRDTGKEFELKGYLLKMKTNTNYNVELNSLLDKKLLCDFAKGMSFEVEALSKKTNRDRTLIKLLKSPAILASRITTKFLSSDPNELFDRLKLLLQEKQTGLGSHLINDEIIAIVDE